MHGSFPLRFRYICGVRHIFFQPSDRIYIQVQGTLDTSCIGDTHSGTRECCSHIVAMNRLMDRVEVNFSQNKSYAWPWFFECHVIFWMRISMEIPCFGASQVRQHGPRQRRTAECGQTTGLLPSAMVRSVWAGAARLGVVLWSSDIFSTFEELTAQVKIGVGATISGIPWWTTDVGGFGCPVSPYNNTSPYMQELIVRWYQFGVVSPVFRTHGCRAGAAEVLPASSPCMHAQGMKPQGPQGSCGFNEVWSYGPAVEPVLTALVRFRNDVLAPYILALSRNVSLYGVPTMRPLWYDFPRDDAATDSACDDQFMLGPLYMAAPVTTHGARSRSVYFPGDASVGWEEVVEVGGETGVVHTGGTRKSVLAPLQKLLLYRRL
eukprot:m.536299 g.536299  ORF g.536299 m.536299 type:complete len:377 (+) comp22071_c0_seq5:2239-3369(+)